MPIYAYRCDECGHTKDVLQKVSDAPLTDCPECGKPALKKQVERLRDALAKDGETKQAAALTSLLTAAERTKEMAPSRLARSRARRPSALLAAARRRTSSSNEGPCSSTTRHR